MSPRYEMTLVVPQPTWKQRWRSPLVIAFLVSLFLHLDLFILAWIFPRIVDSAWFPPWLKPVVASIQPKAPAPPMETSVDTMTEFVEVNPDTITTEAPPDAQKFSDANTLAANPDPLKVDSMVPKIDGKRPDSNKSFDTATPVPSAEPPPKPTPDVTPKEAAAPALPVGGSAAGQTVQAKPVPNPTSEVAQQNPADHPVTEARPNKPKEAEAIPESKPKRYKKISEARAAKGIIVGEKKQQEGGVPRLSIQASENVKASPFGDYGLKLTAAVQARWFELLDERKFSFERTGQVTVTFRLHSDGHVSAIQDKPSTVGENLALLCILSIDQSAPFGAWPAPMRGWIGKEFIDITFTFNYLLN